MQSNVQIYIDLPRISRFVYKLYAYDQTTMQHFRFDQTSFSIILRLTHFDQTKKKLQTNAQAVAPSLLQLWWFDQTDIQIGTILNILTSEFFSV